MSDADRPPSAAANVAELQRRLGYAPPGRLLWAAIRELFPARIAVVSSFGAESAVLLHLVTAIDPATPVLFIDTGRHFIETLRYRDRLKAHLGLRDVRSVGPTAEEIARLDPDGSRATWDPEGCCAFRKTAPLQRALGGFDAWVSGRKRFQAATRLDLPAFEADGAHVKINPLASWSASDLAAYAVRHGLPPHPLVAQGFASIGCASCTSAVRPGEEQRAGRWRGFDKTECGIHLSLQHPAGK
ncbi:MAG: phosphoadenosine phosphosulfate reductase [Alphaproteobacteria bacterium 65-37]|jgi:phosphoadenosine phosphosulfate reductase|nr:phosphoadenylyl-sulfate reductase [Alphaproteobacteria bacterium]OJU35932.1 MAG: phosphoadenosine phosphosulfate reductase [Alphaproteobacteria bacterium 65-37]